MFTYIFFTIVAVLIIAAIATSKRTPSLPAYNDGPTSFNGETSTSQRVVTARSLVISRRRAPSFARRIQNQNGTWGWYENGFWVQDIVQDMLDEIAYNEMFDHNGMFMENILDSDIHSDDFAATTPEIEVEPIAVNETPTKYPEMEQELENHLAENPSSLPRGLNNHIVDIVDNAPTPTPSAPAYEAPSAPAPSYDPPSYSGGGGYDSGGSSGGSDSGGGGD